MALAACLLAGCGSSSPPVTQYATPAASVAEFERRIEALRRDLNIPGLGLAIASGQRIVSVRGLGLADVENAAAPTGDTTFHLASLTKTYASTVLLQLVEEGRLCVFALRADLRPSVGLDAFNVFNNVIFGGMNTNITSAAFGRVSSQANTPRVLQLKARLDF